MYPFVRCMIVATTLFTGAATAHAESPAASGFQISLSVPEICQIEATDMVAGNGEGASATQVFEMCNSRRGFRIVASHRPLLPGERVQINYAGQLSELDASGVSDIAVRNGPKVGHVPVLIQSDALADPIAISFGMLAI